MSAPGIAWVADLAAARAHAADGQKLLLTYIYSPG